MELNKVKNWLQSNNVEIQYRVYQYLKMLKKLLCRFFKKLLHELRNTRLVKSGARDPLKLKLTNRKMLNHILVVFQSRDMKIEIMKEKKNLANANFSDVNISSINKIYRNENLTKASRNILNHARRFQKESGCKYA